MSHSGSLGRLRRRTARAVGARMANVVQTIPANVSSDFGPSQNTAVAPAITARNTGIQAGESAHLRSPRR